MKCRVGQLKDNSQSVAAAFVGARRARQALGDYPGERPATLAEAYAIQDAALKIDGRTPHGWKVGRIADHLTAALGTNRLAGPIFADNVVDAQDGHAAAMPIFPSGFAAVEAEFLLHIRRDWSGLVPAGDAELVGLIDAVHAGIEIASSPYAAINDDGPLVTISDFGNNGGLIIGPSLGDPASVDFNALSVRVMIDDVPAGPAMTTATMLDGPVGAVRFLLGNLVERGLAHGGDFWISTGAVTGVHPVAPGAAVQASFGSDLRIDCSITGG